MFQIELDWNGTWIPLAGTGYFETRSQAEWVIARWKQANDCRGDPFRTTHVGPEIKFPVPQK